MKIKKYLGATAHEAILELKRELGPDAVVLNTKQVRAKGIFKYFKKPLVEVTAAYEEKHILTPNFHNKYDDKLDNINEELAELKRMMYEGPQEIKTVDILPKTLMILKDRMINNGIYEDVVDNVLEKINSQINLKDKDVDTVEKIVEYSLMEHLGDPQPIIMDNDRKIIFFVGQL